MEDEYRSPVYGVIAVPIDKVVANNYNPNVVAPPEMKLLELSIWEDGYTMPCVCYYDKAQDRYELVDGFHRYMVMKTSERIYKREHGLLPVSIIQKDLSERMASTIRHNRARGTHSVELMSNIVAELTKAWTRTSCCASSRCRDWPPCSPTSSSAARKTGWKRKTTTKNYDTENTFPGYGPAFFHHRLAAILMHVRRR